MYSLIESPPAPTASPTFLLRVAKEFAIAARHENGGKHVSKELLLEKTQTLVISHPVIVRMADGSQIECGAGTHMLLWDAPPLSDGPSWEHVICIVRPMEGEWA